MITGVGSEARGRHMPLEYGMGGRPSFARTCVFFCPPLALALQTKKTLQYIPGTQQMLEEGQQRAVD